MSSDNSTSSSQAGAALQHKTDGDLLLREWAELLACKQDLNALLRASLEKLLDTFESSDAAILFLYKQETKRLVVQYALGYDADSIWHLCFKVGESMVGRVFQSGRAELHTAPQQIIQDVAKMSSENRAHWTRAIADFKHPQGIMSIPLISGDAKIGVLVLESWGKHPAFSKTDLELAQSLALLISVAIDRAILAQRVMQPMVDKAEMQLDIMSTLSHEMRTPLASIKGYATALLLDDVQWDEQTTREYLEIISDESDNLEQIIADLLESSKISAGLLRVERQPTLLARLTHEVLDKLSRRTDKHRFLVSFAPGFPIIDADPHLIWRVLFNLIDNAVKYSPAGGLIVVRGEICGDEVLVSISDQGKGISPEHLNRLFERFFRVDFVSGQHVVGSGLGLPIARSIVEAHGGRIWAESKLGEGSTFYFTLPIGGLSTEIDAEDTDT